MHLFVDSVGKSGAPRQVAQLQKEGGGTCELGQPLASRGRLHQSVYGSGSVVVGLLNLLTSVALDYLGWAACESSFILEGLVGLPEVVVFGVFHFVVGRPQELARGGERVELNQELDQPNLRKEHCPLLAPYSIAGLHG